MSIIRTTHNHAAPFMRRRLIDTITLALHSKTKRDRLAYYKAAHAWGSAVVLLNGADDYVNVEGIADLDTAPIDALRDTLRFLGSHPEEILSKEGVADIEARLAQFEAAQS